MHDSRPGGVTLLCWLIVLGAIIELITAQQVFADFDTQQWLQTHAHAARVQELFHFVHAGVSLLCAYFMLYAKNWARWLYLIWNGARVATAGALLMFDKLPIEFDFLRLKAGMAPNIVFFIVALCLLWRADAREYFFLGGRRRRDAD